MRRRVFLEAYHGCTVSADRIRSFSIGIHRICGLFSDLDDRSDCNRYVFGEAAPVRIRYHSVLRWTAVFSVITGFIVLGEKTPTSRNESE